MLVAKEYDQFIEDKDEALWIVTLSNNEIIWQDDDRPYVGHHSAWIRLKEYCEHNNLYIVKIQLKFRSHSEFIFCEDSEGYAFRKEAMGGFGVNITHHFYWLGILKNGIVHMEKWRVPELIKEEEEDRLPNSLLDCLILRTNYNS